jgi:hypothetical protein
MELFISAGLGKPRGRLGVDSPSLGPQGWQQNVVQESSYGAAILSRRCRRWVISGHLHCNSPCPLYPRKRTLYGPSAQLLATRL